MCCQVAQLRRTADIQQATPTDSNQSEAIIREGVI